MPTKKTAASTAAPKAASKAAPKKTVSKSAPKKAAPKKTASKTLVYASNQQSFWVNDGQILNSLLALRDALATMDKAVYAVHVTKEKNDFANWVGAVLNDAACAKDLLSAKTPVSAKTVVVRHLKSYSY
ncbi:MAG TPA: hypothetical protein VGE31_02520 [Candidatus Paceibacterota bacterium]